MKTTLLRSGKSKTRIEIERYPMPESIDGICDLVRSIYNVTGVRRLEIEGQFRVTREKEFDPDITELDKSWEEALQGLDNFIEFNPKNSPDHTTVLLFLSNIVTRKGLRPVCFVTGSDTGMLSKWLGLGEMEIGMESLFDIPIRRISSLPEETVILCGAHFKDAEPSEIEFAVKTTIEVREPNETREISSSETSDAVWDNPGGGNQAANHVEVATRELRKVAWKSARNPRT
jgi:hypothetical protein